MSKPITQANFNFLPTGLESVTLTPEKELVFQYGQCYKIVYGKNAVPDHILRHENVFAKIDSICAELACSRELFFLTVMYGHFQSKTTNRFFSGMLLGDAAPRRFIRYKQVIEEQYGSLDLISLDLFVEKKLGAELIESKLLQAEIFAGTWIVGFKLKQAGGPVLPFFEINELRLDELWLAIELNYTNQILLKRLTKTESVEEVKVRHRVSKLMAELKKDLTRAASVFKARERMMPQAISKVVQHFGFQETEFGVNDAVFTDSFKFWTKLALAIQHNYCWNYVNGDKKALRFLTRQKME